jgi:UDPglucose 6-dehydrogenase
VHDDLFPGVDIAHTALEALENADAAVLVTEWPELVALDWPTVRDRMRGRHVIDGRNALDAELVVAAGLVFTGIGTADQPVGEPVASDDVR